MRFTYTSMRSKFRKTVGWVWCHRAKTLRLRMHFRTVVLEKQKQKGVVLGDSFS